MIYMSKEHIAIIACPKNHDNTVVLLNFFCVFFVNSIYILTFKEIIINIKSNKRYNHCDGWLLMVLML